jgi:3',5'-cyclic AMP phosphodiesterase CpdA
MRFAPLALALSLSTFACGGAPSPAVPATVAVPAGTTRYIVGGDSRDDSAHVLPWAFREAKARGASAFFFLGDMELTPQFDAHFRDELKVLDPIPFYPALGNHEILFFGALPIGVAGAEKAFRANFLDTLRTPVAASLPDRVVYSVNVPGGVHFIALDNVTARGFGADQLAWLAADLEHAGSDPTVKHIFVGMHKPLAKNGVSTHGMDSDGAQAIEDSDAALALFQKAGVSVIFASHVHEFAKLTQGGISTYITGGLGAPLIRTTADHAFHHFLVVDVTDTKVSVDVIRFDGTPSIGTEEIGE